MEGRHGILKSDFNAQSLRVSAASVRVDDLVAGRDVCLFKADVEGYEPQVPNPNPNPSKCSPSASPDPNPSPSPSPEQVLQTAQTLLATRSVPSLQLELTRTRGSPDQTCAAIKMLRQLATLGYTFRQVPNDAAAAVDANHPDRRR